MPWKTREILAATGGKLLYGDTDRQFSRVSIDSRNINSDDLFVAIVGEVHDGHAFVEDVVRQGGVSGVMVNQNSIGRIPASDWQGMNVTCIAVDDTTVSLGDLAAYSRGRADVMVAAITGSNGKTTTRRLTSAVMKRGFNTLSTVGNFNNQIGLPLTLLNLQQEHQWAVVEIGTNSPGEIARLAEICNADLGVITNIGPAHLEKLGSLDGVLREKGDLLKHLKPGGSAILNADDNRLCTLADQTDKAVVLFGQSKNATVRAREIGENESGVKFTLVLPEAHIEVLLAARGHFMVTNALAAAATAYLAGLSIEQIKSGLESFRPAAGRMSILETPEGIHIIDDSYNANPESMQAAINTLKTAGADCRTIIVSGDMLELGEQAESMHQHIGTLAAESGIRRLYVTGDFAEAVVTGARRANMSAANIFKGSKDDIIADLKQSLKSGDWVLVKGSRGMAMEDVVNAIKIWAGVETGNVKGSSQPGQKSAK
jgi:UDP-N-acetylmuramoyl-tripeptide--D-alanyl-D-alanine ligase